MPKPRFGINGSGMHINLSLASLDGNNAFYDPADPMQLSETTYAFLAGVIKNARGFAAVTNPTVNSYKRLVPGYEAPVMIAWSASNRSPLIRIPAKRGNSTRIELRNPDPSANPYLALAAILRAGLDGIKNKLTPPDPVVTNLYEMNDEERSLNCIDCLPGSLFEAVQELVKNDVIKGALGPHITEKFIDAALYEWKKYSAYVSQWELDRYLRKF